MIFAGVASSLFTSLQATTGDSAASRGESLGRGVDTLIFIIAGIVLIIMHFVRRNRR